jgi:hypothetical protein
MSNQLFSDTTIMLTFILAYIVPIVFLAFFIIMSIFLILGDDLQTAASKALILVISISIILAIILGIAIIIKII